MASTSIACPRETTDKRRTTTTNSSSSHHHDSEPSRPHSLICTGAEPIHPVHASSQLCRAAVAPRNEVIFLPFWRGFLCTCSHQYTRRFFLFPPSTGRCAAQYLRCERTFQLDSTTPLYIFFEHVSLRHLFISISSSPKRARLWGVHWTAQVDTLLAAPSDSLFKRSSLRCILESIHVT